MKSRGSSVGYAKGIPLGERRIHIRQLTDGGSKDS